MRLIDADALKAYIDAQKGRPWIGCTIGEALKIMTDEQPTIEPQRTGKWIHGRELSREMIGDMVMKIFYEGWECSECHCLVEEEREPLWKYCPNCGVKMEEPEDIPMEYFESGGR